MRLDEKRTYWDLSSFVVSPKFRGNGIGNDLLNSIFFDKPIYLKVKQDNPAITLYQKNNFKQVAVSNGRYIMKLS